MLDAVVVDFAEQYVAPLRPSPRRAPPAWLRFASRWRVMAAPAGDADAANERMDSIDSCGRMECGSTGSRHGAQVIARGCLRRGAGNSRSIASQSSCAELNVARRPGSRADESSRAAFGIAMTSGWRKTHASAIWAAVTPWRARSARDLASPASVPWSIGQYAIVATTVLAVPWQQVELDAALARRVVDLVGDAARAGGRTPQFAPCRRRRSSTRPSVRCARHRAALRSRDGLGQWMAAAPVQQVQVDGIEPQSAPAAVTGLGDAAGAGVVRIDLGDDEDFVAAQVAGSDGLGQGLPDDLLGATFAVHLGGIDQPVAQFERAPHRGDFGVARLWPTPRAARCRGRAPERRAGLSGQAHGLHRIGVRYRRIDWNAGQDDGRRGSGLPRSSSAMRCRYAANSGSSPFSSLGSRW